MEIDGASSSYTMGVNEFSDLTEEEFQKFATGGQALDERLESAVFYDFEEEREIENYYVEQYL